MKSTQIAQIDKTSKATIAVHPSLNAAAKAVNGAASNICAASYGFRRHRSAYGFVWRRVTEDGSVQTFEIDKEI